MNGIAASAASFSRDSTCKRRSQIHSGDETLIKQSVFEYYFDDVDSCTLLARLLQH